MSVNFRKIKKSVQVKELTILFWQKVSSQKSLFPRVEGLIILPKKDFRKLFFPKS
jgi:hypothetical protein